MVLPFYTDCQKQLPLWFHEISIFNPIQETFAPQVLEGFQCFEIIIKILLIQYSKLFIQFSVTWIVWWNYTFLTENFQFSIISCQFKLNGGLITQVSKESTFMVFKCYSRIFLQTQLGSFFVQSTQQPIFALASSKKEDRKL